MTVEKFEARMGGRVALVRQVGNYVLPALREPKPTRAEAEEVAELTRTVAKMSEELRQMEHARKGITETDAGNREKWSEETLRKLIASGLALIERRRLSCAEAGAFLFHQSPADQKLIEDFDRFTDGPKLTPMRLAELLAEAFRTEGRSRLQSAEQICAEVTRKSIDLVEDAYLSGEDALRKAGRPVDRLYAVFSKAVRDVSSGLIPGTMAASAVLQVALADIEG